MPIISTPQELTNSDLFLDLRGVVDRAFYLKCEGMNFGGSIKVRTAEAMFAAVERTAGLHPDSVLIESSSGNLGIALSIIAANRGIPFICVTDRRCNENTLATMRALGADLVVLDEPDPAGGFLKARLDWVRRRCAEDPRCLWLNQYTNWANPEAHYLETAPAILDHFPDLDLLFVGVGTGGTAVGCARYFRDNYCSARIVAVDTIGSVSFGYPSAPRLIPGLGASVPPPLLDQGLFDDLVRVPELEAVRVCRMLASRGMLFGGSTGTVLAGALQWLADNDPERTLQSVGISADMGERYLDTVYDDTWVLQNFGADALGLSDRRSFLHKGVTCSTSL